MNKIKAKIKTISTKENLSFIEADFSGEPIYLLSLELSKDIKINNTTWLGIKHTNIAISKDFNINSSFLNQLKVSIVNIEEGDILTVVLGAINGVILESVISTKAYYRLDIKVGDSVIFLLPALEIFIL
jgi:molybdopterin-binding protein